MRLAAVTKRSRLLSLKTYPSLLEMLEMPSGKPMYKVGVDLLSAQRVDPGIDTFFRRGQGPSF